MYMQLELSVPSDVLPAIAGCAQAFAVHNKFNYVAGMWEEMLATTLLWHVRSQKTMVNPKPRPKDSTAPTWSWASVSMNQIITHIDSGRSHWWLTSDALLSDMIKEVHCEPKSATNPFGKLKDAYLKLDATLYPWYLRFFCRMATKGTNWKRGSWTVDLYVERSSHSIKCTTDIQEIAVGNALVELCLDVRLAGEGLVIETFKNCLNSSPSGRPTYPCKLARIYMLHVLHKESHCSLFDVFLLLKQIPPANGKPNCYQRVGLVKMASKVGCIRTWQEMIEGKLKPRNEEFWLF